MPIFRTLTAWLSLAVLMSVNGALREFALVPAFGRPAAEIASVILGLAIILAVTWFFFRPLAGARTTVLVEMGLALLLLTVVFELVLGHYVTGMTWSALAGTYAFWKGEPWPLMLLVVALTPLLWARWLVPHRTPAHA